MPRLQLKTQTEGLFTKAVRCTRMILGVVAAVPAGHAAGRTGVPRHSLMTQGTFIGGSKTGKKHHGWSGQTNSSSRCESVPTAVGIVRPLYISTSTKICCTAVVTQHSITSRSRWVTGSSMYDLCLGGRPHKNDSPASKLHDRGGHKHTHSKCARWQRPFRSPILAASSLPLLAPALVVGVFTF